MCHQSYYNIIVYIPYAVHQIPQLIYFITVSFHLLISLLISLILQNPSPLVTTILFLGIYESLYVLLCLFVSFVFQLPHISEIMQYFSLTFFTWHNTLQVQPCCCKWQDFIIFLWLSDIPLHIYTTSSLSLHLSLLHLGCFYILAIVDIPAMNMEVNIYFQIRIFIYLICTQEWNC